jgi:hypothetical protein
MILEFLACRMFLLIFKMVNASNSPLRNAINEEREKMVVIKVVKWVVNDRLRGFRQLSCEVGGEINDVAELVL